MRASSLRRALLVAGVLLLTQPLASLPARAAAGGGGVPAWGWDSFGQLGDGGTSPRSTPLSTPAPEGGAAIVAVAAGAVHNLGLRSDGTVVAWGSDSSGQLGDGGSNTNQSTPVAVSGLGPGSGVVALAAGDEHSLAVRSDGTVLAWGSDGFGQLGDGGTNTNQSTPVAVSGLGAGSGVIAVAAGAGHSLALRSDGQVLSWGDDAYGQLGDGGTNAPRATPVAVAGLGPGSGVVAVAAGDAHNLALHADGRISAWGDDFFGQLGDGGANADQATPVDVTGLGTARAVAVAAGFGHSLAVRSDGTVLAWGSDVSGQLGDGPVKADQPVPAAVSGLGAGSGVVSVAAGGNHSLALRSDGSVMAWGSDSAGQLGDGGLNEDRAVPGPVSGLGAGSGIVAVAAGDAHSLAVLGTTQPGSTFAPLSPARVWDTRVGPGPVGRIGAGATRSVTVTGVGGVPASGVTAIVLNVTAVAPSAGTFVTAWPAGEARPLASNLNIPPGDTRPNLVTVKVGAAGQVSFANDAGTTDLIADVAGWYGPTGGQRYTGVSPSRVWDSRVGPGPTGRLGVAATRSVKVTGIGGVPATGVTAVVLNVTAVGASAGTYVTAWPSGEGRPQASNLNVPAGDTRANLVTVKVGANGQVSFYNDAGTTDLIADVAGWFGTTGSSLTSTTPRRAWDSRVGPGPLGRIEAGGTRNVTVTGTADVPAAGVTAVVLNVTAVSPSVGTFATAWPTAELKPLASNLNLPGGDIRANLVIVRVGAGGQVSFSNDAGTTDLIVDVAGWFGAPGA